MQSPTILIIDDEDQIRKLLKITLESNGFRVRESATGVEGQAAATVLEPDMVLLDVGLPDISGHDVLLRLREWFTNPILIISAQNNEDDIIQALDNGANDYIVKPFRTLELLARIRSQLLQIKPSANSLFTFDDLVINLDTRDVIKNGIAIKLTATEFALMEILVRNEGKVLTHRQLLKNAFGPENELQHLRVFVSQLRKKIESDPNRPSHIITESGIGYRFVGHPISLIK